LTTVLLGGSIVAISAACSGTASPAAPTAGTTVTSPAMSSSALEQTLVAGFQDENHAYWVYRRVMADFGSIRPFANIVYAEQQHADAIAGLLRARGWTVPPSVWSLDNAPRFESVAAACRGAAQAERDNIALYDELLSQDLPDDVRQVFQNNRAASLNNHLPAFSQCG
jgi:hypothetical protein